MIDTESGETAPLKPTTGQKTRGLTALVVACAALSFFAGAAATNGLRTAVVGPMGTASKDDASTDGDLNLQFTGVPRASI